MTELDKAADIYRKEGILALVQRGSKYTANRLRNTVSRKIENKYWGVRGSQRFTVANTVAEFNAKKRFGGDVIRGHVKSESKVLHSFISNLGSDDVVFDVGGHLGLYTCFAANALSEGKVVVYEPFPANLVGLLDNISRNDESRVSVITGALADDDGLIPISSPTLTEDYGSPSIDANQSSALFVSAFRGDSLITNGEVPIPTVVKIDVEGAEGVVIDGLSNTLAEDKCKRLYCEIHPPAPHRTDVTDFGHRTEDIIEKIHDLGFSIQSTYERGTDKHLICTKE